MTEIDLAEWVETSSGTNLQKSAVHILLHAIGSSDQLRASMIMKGGNLLGVRYKSKRYTKDVDFSTATKFKDFKEDEFSKELNELLTVSAAELGYTITCWVQKTEVQPNAEGTFPTLQIKIGCADRSNKSHIKFIEKGTSPITLKVDYSFNEETYESEIIKIGEDANILAYSIYDIVAEKYRSVLQQVVRDRNREQDIYDLNFILDGHSFDDAEKFKILSTFLKKCEGKELESLATINGLDVEEVKARSGDKYGRLIETVVDLPDFEDSYERVRTFYKSLPWELS